MATSRKQSKLKGLGRKVRNAFHRPEPSNPPGPSVSTAIQPVVSQTLDLWQQASAKANDRAQKWMKQKGCGPENSGLSGTKLQDIIKIAKEKESECEDKPWYIPIGKQRIVLRDYAADVVRCLTMIGDAVLPFAPTEVSGPWSVLKAVMQIPVSGVEQLCALFGTVDTVARTIRRGRLYEAVYNQNNAGDGFANLQEALLRVYTAAIELMAESDTLFSKGVCRQTLHAVIHPDKAKGLAADLFKAEQKLSLEVQACESMHSTNIDPLLSRVDEGVASLLQKVEESERNALIEFISKESYGDVYLSTEESRAPDTGEWLLSHKEFEDWQRIPSSSTLLWLEGTAGTGKTFLTSNVIKHVKMRLDNTKHDEGFAYFFCTREGQSRVNPTSVLRSFVRQLACFVNDEERMQANLVKQVKSAKKNGNSGLSYTACEELILSSVNLYSKTTIVLDALDQADVTKTHNLAKSLVHIFDNATRPVKIFVSSRTRHNVTTALDRESTIIIGAKTNNEEDVGKVLKEELYSDAWYQSHSEATKSEISKVLTTRSQGVIRWVVLQVKRIKRIATADDVLKQLKTLPGDLKESYGMSFQEIKDNGSTDLALAERAIKWVMCSYQALRFDVLLHAIRLGSQGLEFEGATPEKLRTLCEDFLVVDRTRNTWELAHISVTEYFQDNHWKSSEADLLVAHASLKILDKFTQIDLVTIMRAVDDSVVAVDLDKLDAKTQDIITTLKDPLWTYAIHHWPLHINRYETDIEQPQAVDSELSRALMGFLGSPSHSSLQYRQWLQFITYSESVPTLRPYAGWPTTSPFHTVNMTDFLPAKISLFIMCRFSIYYTLHEWWEREEIDHLAATTGTYTGLNALAIAAIGGSNLICERLMRTVDVNFPISDDIYGSVLVAAVANRQHDTAKYLIKSAGAEVNARVGGFYGSALIAAVARCSVVFIQWLLNEGGAELKLSVKTKVFDSPLAAAALRGRVNAARLLLESGSDVNEVFEHGDRGSALAVAAMGNHPSLEVLKMLLNHGATVDLPLRTGKYGSALATAAYWSSVGSMKELVRAGADVNRYLNVGKYGSALIAASRVCNDDRGTDYLIQAGAKVNMEVQIGVYGSALVAAACFPKVNPNVACLLDARASPTLVLKTGEYGSALAAASFWGNVDDLRDMLRRTTPDIASETLSHSRHPPVTSEEYMDMKKSNNRLGRDQVWRVLVEEVGLDRERLLRIGLEAPLDDKQITLQSG